MKVICKIQLEMDISNVVLEDLLKCKETRTTTLDIFKDNMTKDLSVALSSLPSSKIEITSVEVKEKL